MVTADADGILSVDVPPTSTVVLMADREIATPADSPVIDIVRPMPGAEIPTFRYRIEAELSDDRYAEVTFSVSVDGGEPVLLGHRLTRREVNS